MKALVAFALLFLPLVTSAAGFAEQSIFLSKDSVTEGDTVLVHVVVSNPSANPFVGTLTIADEASTIGTLQVNLAPGGADTFSASWHPIAGTHTVTAKLANQTGAVTDTQQASFTIAAKPAPKAASTASTSFPSVEPSTPLDQQLQTISPAAASSAVPLLSAIDKNRAVAANALYQGVNWAQQQLKDAQRQKAATSTQSAGSITDTILHTAWIIAVTLFLYACSIARSVVTSIGLFYPIIAFLILYLLWRGYRAVRRPRY